MMLSGELLQGGEKWCNRLQESADNPNIFDTTFQTIVAAFGKVKSNPGENDR